MKAFADLTQSGRTRRLGKLVSQVVSNEYQLVDAEIQMVAAHSFNTVFRVTVAGGRRYAFRLGGECRIHDPDVEDVESAWLDALAADGIAASVNVPTAMGSRRVVVSDPAVPEERVCSMFTWLNGHELRRSMSEERVRAAGSLLAQLHDHAASVVESISVPPSLHAKRAVYLHRENRVLAHPSRHGDLFVEATERVQDGLDLLWQSEPHRPHLLHGDFGPHNVLSHRQQLYPIDFQDLQFGFDVQDVALSLTDLRRRAPELVTAFSDGYRAVRPWPDLSPDQESTFAAARSLNIMNLGLHVPNSGIGQVFDEHATRVVAWMSNR